MLKHEEFEVTESDLYIHTRWHLLNNHNNRICLRYKVVLNKHVLKTTKSKKTVIKPLDQIRWEKVGWFQSYTMLNLYLAHNGIFIYCYRHTIFSFCLSLLILESSFLRVELKLTTTLRYVLIYKDLQNFTVWPYNLFILKKTILIWY